MSAAAVRSRHRQASRPTATFRQIRRAESAVGMCPSTDGITLSDEGGHGDRPPSRLIAGSAEELRWP